jgi:hypothetical protein
VADVRIFLIVVLWIAGLLPPAQADDLVPGYWEQTPLPHTGLATFYAAGMMEHVLTVRAGHGQVLRCEECVGTVALLRAGDIGRKVWLQPPGGEKVGPFLVIDCARQEDIPPLVARNWAVDVSFEVGQLWGMDRPLADVTVLADPAAELRTDSFNGPLAAPTPFFVPPGQVVLSAPTPTPRVSPTPWRPTPWPTRLPSSLVAAATPTIAPDGQAEPANLQTPGPPRPTPLTPMVTTPTPRVTPLSSPTPGTPGAAPLAPTPTVTPAAVGRPGAGLLESASTPAAPTPARPTVTPTPLRLATPLATSAPILPRQPTVTPTPQGTDGGGLLDRLRSLLGLP